MKVYSKLFSILFVGLISGCSSLTETEEIPEPKKKVEIYAGFTEWMNVPVKECRGYKDQLLIPANFDMKNFLTTMTAPSCAALSGYDTKSIVMSDGVNLKNLKTDVFGLSLSDQLRDRFVELCNLPIRQVSLSQTIKLNTGGATLLTRDAKEALDQEINADFLITPIYEMNDVSVRVGYEVIKADDRTLISSGSRQISLGCQRKHGYQRFVYTITK